jgi:hypothetical protein
MEIAGRQEFKGDNNMLSLDIFQTYK